MCVGVCARAGARGRVCVTERSGWGSESVRMFKVFGFLFLFLFLSCFFFFLFFFYFDAFLLLDL